MLIDERSLAIQVLRSIKRFFKFRELEEILGLPTPTIWRYIHGDVKPSVERARELTSRLLSPPVISRLMERVLGNSNNELVNVYKVAYSVDVLRIASIDAYLWSRELSPTAVLTIETDGIPLATMIAMMLNTKLLVAKKRREVGFEHFIDVSYLAYDPPEIVTLYLPRGLLTAEDRVIIVDDLVRSGKTSKALAQLISKARAQIKGFYALLAIGDGWRKNIESITPNYRIFYSIRR